MVCRSHGDLTGRNDEAAAAYVSDGAFDFAATRTALAAWTSPVLVLGGAFDGWPSPRVCAELAALFPNGELVVQAEAGHFPWLDDPAAFSSAVAAFL